MQIARQAKGKPWAEIIVQRLRRIAVYVLPKDFRPAFVSTGRDALVARIQELVDAMPS